MDIAHGVTVIHSTSEWMQFAAASCAAIIVAAGVFLVVSRKQTRRDRQDG